MPSGPIDRVRKAILEQQYVLSEHAYEEMDNDSLDALDVEAAVLTGAMQQVLTDDPRGVRYVIVGNACDLVTRVGVVVRFVENDQLLIITVYEIR